MALPQAQTIAATSAVNRLRVQGIRYLYLLKKRWWVLLLLLSLGLCIGAWTAMQQPPAWLSSGRLMVSGQMKIGESAAAYSEELVNFFGTQIELMQSAKVLQGAETRVLALHPDLPREQVKMTVGQLPKAAIFQINVYGKSPAYSQAYLDAVMDEYIAKKKEMRENRREGAAVAIQDELVRLEKDMLKEEEEMHTFQKENNIGFLKEDGNSAATYLSLLNRQLADHKTEFDLLKLLDLDQNLDRNPQSPGGGEKTQGRMDSLAGMPGPLGEYLKAKQSLQQLMADRLELSKSLKPRHPSIVALDEQIIKSEALLQTYRELSQNALQSRRESIDVQIKNLEGTIKIWEGKALDLARRVADWDKIRSKIERTKVQYDRLNGQLRSMDVYKNLDQDTVAILEQASKPRQIQMELNKLLLIGGVCGFGLGLLILFVLDKMDDRIGSFFEFRERFPESLLGQVPRELGKVGVALLVSNDPRHALLESFRTLRSSIIFLPVEGMRPKTLLVTSATPGEGKTTIAANLAITFAFSGAKTLLVDADLRLGRIAKAFKIESEAGLSDVLRQRAHWREVIVPTSTPNLSVLPRGKTLSHPAEHFLGKVTDQFLQEVYAEFDYIIFDSPPVMAADDVLSLAPKIDGTIFVIRFSTSSARRSRTAINLLVQRQANLLGVVCNDVRLAESEYGYGSYYQYSSYREHADSESDEPVKAVK
ncbi:MAG: polysaccharide biosynthesis tyrosine autokinase [Chthoniobacteraceae bacterium]